MHTGYNNCATNIDSENKNVQFLYTMLTKTDTFVTNFIISYREG